MSDRDAGGDRDDDPGPDDDASTGDATDVGPADGSPTDKFADEGESEGPTDEERTDEPYEVFVQWERGKPHEYAETVNASDAEMALLLAKRNVDVRAEPLNIKVAPQRAFLSTDPDDPTLSPSTDRSYRNVAFYAQQLTGLDE